MELAVAAAAASSPPPPESDVAPPPPPPEPPEKASCGDTLDARGAAEKRNAHQELDQVNASSSSLNSCNESENHMSSHDEMAGSESKAETVKTEGDSSSEEKVLKKPDKILPCPRCNSMETKFCYYNNYNVNQPRHFCKSCQRYWTAGGSMRNIPVGAGRRKSKHSAPHCRSIMIPSSSLGAPGGDASLFPAPTKGNEPAVKFGPDSPLCNTMASVLSIGEQKKNTNHATVACPTKGEDVTCVSSATASNCAQNESLRDTVGDNQNGMEGHCNGVPPVHPLPCFPVPPFVYPWNPAWNGIPAFAAPGCSSDPASASENGNSSNIPWNMPPMMPVPGFCGPAVPFPVVPPSVWAFMSAWPNGLWSAPWLGPGSSMPASSSTSSSSYSDSSSPVLGKHSRESKLQGDEKAEKSLWIPKTLRIDDPDEAAKSSIWTTLGIEPGERGMFRPFQSKPEGREQISSTTKVLQANPAALSRSQSFQEMT